MKLPLNDSGSSSSTYFIADIAANHDGSLDRALELIRLAAKAGANAAKFQNFRAETIVSRQGFQELGRKLTHQSKWEKDVYEVYRDAALPIEWTDALITECAKHQIDYFTAPYDLEYIDFFAHKMPFFKVGSGDITWKQSLLRMATFGKPILLATGASNLQEVDDAVNLLEENGIPIVLMQCNTNYTGEKENFDFLNLNVLKTFQKKYPKVILGLSDHSPGFVAVLGAIALGARVIEKHFTDDTSRVGPDHGFSLDPKVWREMVDTSRILERALGDGVKRVEANEVEPRIVQRRGYRYNRSILAGEVIEGSDLIALRPCPNDGLTPFQLGEITGRILKYDVNFDELVRLQDFE